MAHLLALGERAHRHLLHVVLRIKVVELHIRGQLQAKRRSGAGEGVEARCQPVALSVVGGAPGPAVHVPTLSPTARASILSTRAPATRRGCRGGLPRKSANWHGSCWLLLAAVWSASHANSYLLSHNHPAQEAPALQPGGAQGGAAADGGSDARHCFFTKGDALDAAIAGDGAVKLAGVVEPV